MPELEGERERERETMDALFGLWLDKVDSHGASLLNGGSIFLQKFAHNHFKTSGLLV